MLVDRYAAETYRLAAAIVGEGDARDLTQETFVQAWTQLGRLRESEAFHAWLRRICVNRCRNWLRSRKRRGETIWLGGHEPVGAGADGRPDFRSAVEARTLLEPAFERLSADQRAVLALHYSMGYSIAEAADALGIRVGTAKSRLSAGLSVLRRAIEPAEPDKTPEVAS